MAEMTRDFNSVCYATPILAHAVIAGAASESNTTAKRTIGCRGGAFIVSVGNIEAGGTIYLTFQHSADNSTWSDLTPIGLSSADIEITDAGGLGEENIAVFAVDELYEGGYIRAQHYNSAGDTTTEYGINFIGFRAINRPVVPKWRIGEAYAVDDIVQNDGFYFKCIVAVSQAVADAEELAASSATEPGTGGSWDTYFEIYKGEAL